jgi:NAD(P)-dependent dehydrogenase (short-subunit alcohol dehydrogenase family)
VHRWDGRVAVVTGAASGIGRALASAFAAKGCRVVLADVERPALDDAAAELAGTGVDCFAVPTDVSDAAAVGRLRDATLARYGAAHVLCNNAGVSRRGALVDQALEDWRWTLGVNLWGVVHGLHAFLPVLQAQDEAHVVNTASIAGLLAFPMGGPYNASKHAIVGLTETLALELRAAGSRVGVSLLCPGAVRTRITEAERNRPPALARPVAAGATPPVVAELERQNELTRALIAGGRDPSAIAAEVLDAIEHDRFYVLTHRDEFAAEIEARTRRMLAGEAPQPVGLESIARRGRTEER